MSRNKDPMIEINITIFRKWFIAFGLIKGADVFSGTAFQTAQAFRLRLLGYTAYLYIDTPIGLNARICQTITTKQGSFQEALETKKARLKPGDVLQIGRA